MSNTVLTWSPSKSASETRIPRRVTRIPECQQSLLDSPSAWLASSATAPKAILELLEATYVSKSTAQPVVPESNTNTKPTRSLEQEQTRHSSANSPPQNERPPFSEDQDEDQETSTPSTPFPKPSSAKGSSRGPPESDDEGSEVSWPPTPSRNARAPSLGEKADADLLDEKAESDTRPPSRQSPLPSSRRQVSRAVAQAPYLPVVMSSSSSSPPSPEPESIIGHLELPADVAVSGSTAVTLLSLDPTPSSAQIIPCSFTIASPVTQREPKRRKLMKRMAEVYSPEPTRLSKHSSCRPLLISESSRVLNSSPASITSAHYPRLETHMSSSSAEGSEPPAARAPTISDETPKTSLAQPSTGSSDIPPLNGTISQIPFIAFMIAYPDCKCSLHDFIRGVLYIQNLRNLKMLPSFLYDDMMRVFCVSFMEYIATLGPHEKPLAALQWYNANVSSPVYTKGILTAENLDYVLDQYPNEVRTIQGPTKKTTEVKRPDTAKAAEPMPSAANPDDTMPDAPATTSPAVHVDELASDPIETAEDLRSVMELGLPEPQTVKGHIASPQRQGRTPQSTSIHKSPGSVVSPLQTQVEMSLPAISPGTRNRAGDKYTPMAVRARDIRPPIPISSTACIPEIVTRPRLPSRPPPGSLISKPRGLKGPKTGVTRNSTSRESRWREHIRKNAGKFSSSAPSGSALS